MNIQKSVQLKNTDQQQMQTQQPPSMQYFTDNQHVQQLVQNLEHEKIQQTVQQQTVQHEQLIPLQQLMQQQLTVQHNKWLPLQEQEQIQKQWKNVQIVQNQLQWISKPVVQENGPKQQEIYFKPVQQNTAAVYNNTNVQNEQCFQSVKTATILIGSQPRKSTLDNMCYKSNTMGATATPSLTTCNEQLRPSQAFVSSHCNKSDSDFSNQVNHAMIHYIVGKEPIINAPPLPEQGFPSSEGILVHQSHSACDSVQATTVVKDSADHSSLSFATPGTGLSKEAHKELQDLRNNMLDAKRSFFNSVREYREYNQKVKLFQTPNCNMNVSLSNRQHLGSVPDSINNHYKIGAPSMSTSIASNLQYPSPLTSGRIHLQQNLLAPSIYSCEGKSVDLTHTANVKSHYHHENVPLINTGSQSQTNAASYKDRSQTELNTQNIGTGNPGQTSAHSSAAEYSQQGKFLSVYNQNCNLELGRENTSSAANIVFHFPISNQILLTGQQPSGDATFPRLSQSEKPKDFHVQTGDQHTILLKSRTQLKEVGYSDNRNMVLCSNDKNAALPSSPVNVINSSKHTHTTSYEASLNAQIAQGTANTFQQEDSSTNSGERRESLSVLRQWSHADIVASKNPVPNVCIEPMENVLIQNDCYQQRPQQSRPLTKSGMLTESKEVTKQCLLPPGNGTERVYDGMCSDGQEDVEPRIAIVNPLAHSKENFPNDDQGKASLRFQTCLDIQERHLDSLYKEQSRFVINDISKLLDTDYLSFSHDLITKLDSGDNLMCANDDKIVSVTDSTNSVFENQTQFEQSLPTTKRSNSALRPQNGKPLAHTVFVPHQKTTEAVRQDLTLEEKSLSLTDDSDTRQLGIPESCTTVSSKEHLSKDEKHTNDIPISDTLDNINALLSALQDKTSDTSSEPEHLQNEKDFNKFKVENKRDSLWNKLNKNNSSYNVTAGKSENNSSTSEANYLDDRSSFACNQNIEKCHSIQMDSSERMCDGATNNESYNEQHKLNLVACEKDLYFASQADCFEGNAQFTTDQNIQDSKQFMSKVGDSSDSSSKEEYYEQHIDNLEAGEKDANTKMHSNPLQDHTSFRSDENGKVGQLLETTKSDKDVGSYTCKENYFEQQEMVTDNNLNETNEFATEMLTVPYMDTQLSELLIEFPHGLHLHGFNPIIMEKRKPQNKVPSKRNLTVEHMPSPQKKILLSPEISVAVSDCCINDDLEKKHYTGQNNAQISELNTVLTSTVCGVQEVGSKDERSASKEEGKMQVDSNFTVSLPNVCNSEIKDLTTGVQIAVLTSVHTPTVSGLLQDGISGALLEGKSEKQKEMQPDSNLNVSLPDVSDSEMQDLTTELQVTVLDTVPTPTVSGAHRVCNKASAEGNSEEQEKVQPDGNLNVLLPEMFDSEIEDFATELQITILDISPASSPLQADTSDASEERDSKEQEMLRPGNLNVALPDISDFEIEDLAKELQISIVDTVPAPTVCGFKQQGITEAPAEGKYEGLRDLQLDSHLKVSLPDISDPELEVSTTNLKITVLNSDQLYKLFPA